MSEGKLQFTLHARDMQREREIPDEWVERTVAAPDRTEKRPDGNVHYLKAVPEHDGRILRVVVNPRVAAGTVVTVFFDRRMRRQK